MKTWLLFIDGLGLGDFSSPENPFSANPDSFLRKLLENRVTGWTCFPVDACLSVDGLPQSGTGQVSLLTGRNAAKELGFHHGPFPHTSQRNWLVSGSVVTDCRDYNLNWDLLNVYPVQYFQGLESRKIRLSTFGFLQTLNGRKLHTLPDLEAGEGFPPSLDYRHLSRFGFTFDPGFPEGAARELIARFQTIDLGITEYFFADHLGHEQNFQGLVQAIETLSAFLFWIQSNGNPVHVIICSDHGNCEDLSTSSHTRNPVPLIFNFPVSFVPSGIQDLRVLVKQSLTGNDPKSQSV